MTGVVLGVGRIALLFDYGMVRPARQRHKKLWCAGVMGTFPQHGNSSAACAESSRGCRSAKQGIADRARRGGRMPRGGNGGQTANEKPYLQPIETTLGANLRAQRGASSVRIGASSPIDHNRVRSISISSRRRHISDRSSGVGSIGCRVMLSQWRFGPHSAWHSPLWPPRAVAIPACLRSLLMISRTRRSSGLVLRKSVSSKAGQTPRCVAAAPGRNIPVGKKVRGSTNPQNYSRPLTPLPLDECR